MASDSVSSDDSDNRISTSSDNEGDVMITPASHTWTSAQAKVLNPFKERWFSAQRENRPDILEEALELLLDVTPTGDKDALKTKLVKWLNRTSRRRKKYGPGSLPSLWSILYWYKGDEFNTLADELYPMKVTRRGEKPSNRPNVAGLSKVVSEYMKELRTDPAKADERDKYEELRLEWARTGAPKAKRQMKASRDGAKMISKFAMQLYWQTGMRVVVLAGHKNGNNKIVHGIFDHNTVLGKNAKQTFGEVYSKLASDVGPAFVKYCRANATDDEGAVENESDAEMDDDDSLDLQKGFRRKPRVELERNQYGEPQLPEDCLRTAGDKNKDLDRKKDTLRVWLTGYYNLAKGSKSVRVPWKRIADEPDEFYDRGFLPIGIEIRDPSKMVKEQIEACFRLWRKQEGKGRQPFQFRQVYSNQRGYQPGRGRRIPESGSDSDSDNQKRGVRYEKAKSPSPHTSSDGADPGQESDIAQDRTKKGQGRGQGRGESISSEEEKLSSDVDDEDEGDDGKNENHADSPKGRDRRLQQPKKTSGGIKRRKGKGLRGRTRVKGRAKPDLLPAEAAADPPETSAPKKRLRKGRTKASVQHQADTDHPELAEEQLAIDPNIDPNLEDHSRMYATLGPNDTVPAGYIATPFIKVAGVMTRSQNKGLIETRRPAHGANKSPGGEVNNIKKRQRPAVDDEMGPKTKGGSSKQGAGAVEPRVKKTRITKEKEPEMRPVRPRLVTRAQKRRGEDSFVLKGRRGRG